MGRREGGEEGRRGGREEGRREEQHTHLKSPEELPNLSGQVTQVDPLVLPKHATGLLKMRKGYILVFSCRMLSKRGSVILWKMC